MSLRKRIGKNIRRIRRERDISQEDLAFKSKTSQGHLSAIEKGEVNIKIDTLDNILNALNIDLVDLA